MSSVIQFLPYCIKISNKQLGKRNDYAKKEAVLIMIRKVREFACRIQEDVG